jgi:peptidase C13-like protein
MRRWLRLIAALVLLLAGPASTQSYQPARHSQPPPLFSSASAFEVMIHADAGMQIERDRMPAAELDEHRKLTRALAGLAPQRRGTIDAYVIAVALDSDPVFGREARQAGAVLGRRYGAAGRTIVLAGTDGSGPSLLPRGTPASFALALARVAELADGQEDALIVYATAHGAPFGLYYHDGDSGYGAISPNRLRGMLDQLGLSNRLLILSACYSGVFVPALRSANGAIVTAAAADRASFGCVAENDWTFFGDAMINQALRKPQPLAAAFAEADGLVGRWESELNVRPSQPQFSAGPLAARWLDALEARMPRTPTPPVGRPALETTRAAAGR